MFRFGTRKKVNGGVIFTSEETNEGFVYKDEQAFLDKKGVCYICEAAFNSANENGELLLTPDNVGQLTYEGGVSTHHDIIEYVYRALLYCEGIEKYFEDYANKLSIDKFIFKVNFVEHIAEQLFYNAEWACISTYIQEVDMFEELEYFVENYEEKEEKK